jgi:hypothetical protein
MTFLRRLGFGGQSAGTEELRTEVRLQEQGIFLAYMSLPKATFTYREQAGIFQPRMDAKQCEWEMTAGPSTAGFKGYWPPSPEPYTRPQP